MNTRRLVITLISLGILAVLLWWIFFYTAAAPEKKEFKERVLLMTPQDIIVNNFVGNQLENSPSYRLAKLVGTAIGFVIGNIPVDMKSYYEDNYSIGLSSFQMSALITVFCIYGFILVLKKWKSLRNIFNKR